MLEGGRHYSAKEVILPWAASVLLGAFGAYIIINAGQYTYLDAFSLIIHEAGHLIFRIFGQTMHMLGGTLMQIIIPVLLLLFFYANHKLIPLQICLVLLSQNLVNISVYIADAQVKKLRLFGPPGAKHDWNWLLGQYGLLEYCEDIAAGVIVLAWLILALMFFLPYILRNR